MLSLLSIMFCSELDSRGFHLVQTSGSLKHDSMQWHVAFAIHVGGQPEGNHAHLPATKHWILISFCQAEGPVALWVWRCL